MMRMMRMMRMMMMMRMRMVRMMRENIAGGVKQKTVESSSLRL